MGDGWVAVWVDLPTDVTISRWGPALRWCWVCTLLLGAQTREPGVLVDEEARPLPVRFLARYANVDWHTADEFVERSLAAGKLTRRADGALVIRAWAKRQHVRASVGNESEETRERFVNVRGFSGTESERLPEPSRACVRDQNLVLELEAFNTLRDRGGPGEEDSQPSIVHRIYEHWRTARGKTSGRYDKLSPTRRQKITARLREFPADELIRAIDAVALDPWPDRPRHDDLTVIFRSREQTERFLELADGNGRELTKEEAVRQHLDRLHLEGKL